MAAVLVVFVTFSVRAFAADFDFEVAAFVLAGALVVVVLAVAVFDAPVLAVIFAALRGADFATFLLDFSAAAGFAADFTATRAVVFAWLALLFAAVRDLLRAAAVEAAFDRLTAFLLDGIRATLLWRPLWRRANPAARLFPTTPANVPVVSQATGTMNLG